MEPATDFDLQIGAVNVFPREAGESRQRGDNVRSIASGQRGAYDQRQSIFLHFLQVGCKRFARTGLFMVPN